MRKLIVILLTVLLVAAMTIPANAVTPSLGPKLPEIPDISGSVEVKLPESFWDKWFREHPIRIDWSKVFAYAKVD